jgi:hypothetical protein
MICFYTFSPMFKQHAFNRENHVIVYLRYVIECTKK